MNPGDGAFYAPKIDLHMTDSIGRSWQMGTIQLDGWMPERFDATYTTSEDEPERPFMIHRALFGSFERFIGILIEHFGGAFPLWLAPLQVAVLPIGDATARLRRARSPRRCARAGLRADVDARDEKVGRKIRDAEERKVPAMLVLGGREAEAAPSRCAATAASTRASSRSTRWSRSWPPRRASGGSPRSASV